jgi:hypothetical protein
MRAFPQTDHPSTTDHLAQHRQIGIIGLGGINGPQRHRDVTNGPWVHWWFS